ncbi:S-adenosyl-L-methionine-dependent methyltransferase [Wolfiporia cocos MD-104 SS10]|uniref:S-adenosyl-L-methionine-dependent methyltransferase n=1 Tax=Wolfiporia cocos (strain MD-104) TaxID=742152 RepID=A0A2H3JWH9_WOLCO|nr:S-adenosyl-L-methionine-dependent methyltransferase [Wolfiporia cocos MD-104 SS10]
MSSAPAMAIEPNRSPENPAPADDDGRSDTSSELTEIDQDEFPRYFDERGGRLFHSHGRSPYPLPVDAAEQHRLNRQHALLHRILGRHIIDPVTQVLERRSSGQRCVVDIGTGTGRWVMDMAAQFPQVRFYGLDIVPIQTRHPLPNVMFEMHDLADRTRYLTASIDFVHARDIQLAIQDYPGLVAEAARILRPGGLFVSCEWDVFPSMSMSNGDVPVHVSAPRTHRFFRITHDFLRENGIPLVGRSVEGILQASNAFTNVHVERFRVPIGGWHPELQRPGRRMRQLLGVYATSVKVSMVGRNLMSEADGQALVQGLLDETEAVHGIVHTINVVYAWRAGA